jgi:hypothetical protein
VSQAEKFLRLRPSWTVELLSLLATGGSRVTTDSHDILLKQLKDNFDKVCVADVCMTMEQA